MQRLFSFIYYFFSFSSFSAVVQFERVIFHPQQQIFTPRPEEEEKEKLLLKRKWNRRTLRVRLPRPATTTTLEIITTTTATPDSHRLDSGRSMVRNYTLFILHHV